MSTFSKLITIVGPTASGKSDLALTLARDYKGELIAADSRTIYRGMDIGTAKPHQTAADRERQPAARCGCRYSSEGILHHLIDIVDPDFAFSVADFKLRALRCLSDCRARNVLPFLVGGTGHYVDAVIRNYEMPAVPPDYELRKKLEKKSPAELLETLAEYDPATARTIDRHNPRRLIRALEIVLSTKHPRPPLIPGPRLFDTLELGIAIDTTELYDRIDRRIEKQLKDGLKEEAEDLLSRYGPLSPGMNAIGYREWAWFWEGLATYQETIDRLTFNTRHYAKRQMTWFKKTSTINWLSGPDIEKQARQHLDAFLLKTPA